jgi:hypothetical protein
MNIINRVLRRAAAFACLLTLTAAFSVNAIAQGVYANIAYFTGQGVTTDGTTYTLNTELCGKANGAEVDGPYLLWVMTATGAAHADITGPWGTAPMTKFGNGTFKYISAWYEPGVLLTLPPPGVYGTYDGTHKNVQLVISHGCRPFTTNGAWCSPGFWKNATDAAWAVTGVLRTAAFNTTVFDFWFGHMFAINPTLQTVLDNPPTYSGPSDAGTSGIPLNAFNATGAFLTSKLPGFSFDPSLIGNDDACPIDHFGHLKQLPN